MSNLVTAANSLMIAGSTAVGKTELSIKLAQHFSTELISVDSVQLYKYFNIGSAKPTANILNKIKHHCLDLLEPNERGSVATWLTSANQAYQNLLEQKRLPIFIGGTTLYFSALLNGLNQLPAQNPQLRLELEQLSSKALHDRLKALDSKRAEILHMNDRVRLIRALELVIESGQVNQDYLKMPLVYPAISNSIVLVLVRDRGELYAAINQRTEDMLKAGLLEETEFNYKLYPDSSVLRSLGYKQCVECINDQLRKAELPEEIAQATRRYAKRQSTFWRNEPIKRGWEVNCNTIVDLTFSELTVLLESELLKARLHPQVIYISADKLQ